MTNPPEHEAAAQQQQEQVPLQQSPQSQGHPWYSPQQGQLQFPPAPVVAAAPKNPHLVLGIVGFALSFFFILNIAGLIVSIIALVKSKRKGFSNGFALAGIIIASLGILFIAVIAALTVPTLVDAAQTCARLGDGVHQLNGATYTCTPSSFNVHRDF